MKTGLDRLIDNPSLLAGCGRLGIVTNQAVVSCNFVPAPDAIFQAAHRTQDARITAVFGPQHGYGQTEQDNMLETPDDSYVFADGTRVPLYSLYSKSRLPTPEQLAEIDTLVVDMLDIGCRVYTYMLTLAGCMRVAAAHDKRVIVLDRPNPLGLAHRTLDANRWWGVEGNCLDLKWESFVGWYSIPMRHGLTLGELGNLFKARDKLNLDYRVITVEGLNRAHAPGPLTQEHPWTLPSPNIPSWESAFFFPSFVTLEGTNISEGRGSTLPFQLVGAPYLANKECIAYLGKCQKNKPSPGSDFRGVVMRPHDFRPTFNKHMGIICHGIHFRAAQPGNINLFALGMHFLAFCLSQHAKDFQWKTPGYEYNFTDMPLLLILGDERWRILFESLRNEPNLERVAAKVDETLEWAYNDAQTFSRDTQSMHLYT